MTATELRVPYSSGGMQGFRYAELTGAVEARIASWARGERPAEAVELKPGRVYRDGALAVKLFDRERKLLDRFRRPRSIRSADLAAKLRPVRTPTPYVALAPGGGAGDPDVGGILVTEFVVGKPLSDIPEDEQGKAAFPHFLASIARRGILLGDFHLHNALWNGEEWVLLDLDGIRHGGHRVFARRLIETQWARSWIGLHRSMEVRDLFEVFLDELDLGWDRAKAWQRVERLADRRYPHR